MTPTHSAAREYASHNWWVLPVWWPNPDGTCACGNPGCKDIGKHPITARGQHDATTNLEQIDAWWAQYPQANIGIALAPSGLIAFDVDKPESYTAWDEIEAKYGETQTTVQVSGSGCHHVIFRRPPFAIRGTYDKRITLRGNNFIVAAPSVHKSGGIYRWQDGHAPWQVKPAELPVALADALKRPDQAPSAHNHDYPPAAPEVMRAAQEALIRHGPEIKGNSPQGHTRTAWGILVNDFALSPKEATPLIRAYNALCSPPWPEDKLFSSPCRTGQPWNGPRGVLRDQLHAREQMAIAGYAPPEPPKPVVKEEWLESVSLIHQPPVTFYSTGFPELDKLLRGGFRTRQLCGLIAPPSSGKSAIVGHWLVGLSKIRPVLHCSLELDKHEIFVRYAAHQTGFAWVDGVRGAIPQTDMAKAVKGIRIKIMGADDFDRFDPFASLEAAVERMRQECGIAPIIAIDYIQLMARGALTEMRHKVGELSFRARQLTQKYDTVGIPVFTTQRSMYNTKVVEQMRAAQDPTAYLGAAKESGDIEFDCATLLYLDVDKLHEGVKKPAQIAVARCRQGDVGFVGLRAELASGRFEEDMTAVAEFASEARKLKREEDKLKVCTDAVIEACRMLAGRRWGEQQVEAGKMARTRGAPIDAARKVLVDKGVLVADVVFDDQHRIVPRAVTYRLREQGDIPSVEVGEDDESSEI